MKDLKDVDVELLMIGVASLCKVEAEKVTNEDECAEVKRSALNEIAGRMLHRAHELAPGTYREVPDDDDTDPKH